MPNFSKSRVSLLTIAFTLLAGQLSLTARADTIRPIKLKVGGKKVQSATPILTDGSDVYLPLDDASVLGCTAQLSRRKDTATVTPLAGNPFEVPVVKIAGNRLLSMNAIANALQCLLSIPSGKGDAVLSASIQEVKLTGNRLMIRAGLPIQAVLHQDFNHQPPMFYLDLPDTFLPEGFKAAPIRSGGAAAATNLRVGQFDPTTVRVVVETGQPVAVNLLKKTASGTVALQFEPVQAPLPITNPAIQNVSPARKNTPSSNPEQANQRAGNNLPSRSETLEQAEQPSLPVSGGISSPTSNGPSIPANPNLPMITGIQIKHSGINRAVLHFTTTGPVQTMMRILKGGAELAIDCIHAGVSLPASTIPLNLPLIKTVHVIGKVAGEDAERIVLDTARILAYHMQPDAVAGQGFTLNLNVPTSTGMQLSNTIIVVDPGHGGTESGAVWHGQNTTVYEKDLTLQIGLKLAALLQNAGAQVIMTRTTDTTVPLDSRPELANQNHANIFVSVHIDDCPGHNVASGSTVYYHMDSADSRALAESVDSQIAAVSGLPNRGALSDGVLYQSGLAVLRLSTMPAILVECGFINNDTDRSLLMNSDYQEKFAQAICQGIINYVESGAMPANSNNQPISPNTLNQQ